MPEQTSTNNIDGNIHFFLDDTIHSENYDTDFDINELLLQIEDQQLYNHEMSLPQIINYNENCTVKELLVICEYYGFLKEIKTNKCNKEQIIEILVNFENDPINNDIVFKRQNLWFYINELKNDKFMKKYILW
jgi:tRNA(Ile)-lysidine synthase TilS/MesJ